MRAPGRFTAPEFLVGLLNQFPRLKGVVAHMGAWEWDAYMTLAEEREMLRLRGRDEDLWLLSRRRHGGSRLIRRWYSVKSIRW